ncbi:MAG: NADH:ubiquinone reductase (Na(+)-transporting) subunit C [Prevotellaceae bacterium]|jgi:Na+-transporting NADH:ubiquinone oxidoreductase subunit C|nr:NADH:ubiquinone reductase (Na(+)-transporting) subunit C [Prevotellaceae bacterium]
MKLNTNSNFYTLIYITVIIVVVALMLSIASGALKSRQNANVELDKKKQILLSLPAVELKGADIEKTYAQFIEKMVLLNYDGDIIKENVDFNYVPTKEEFPLYIANVEGQTKYIIPLNGAGLWGAIWGYIALNDDKNTVYGVYFSHASETPGLGSNIVEKPFRQPFEGKHILNAAREFVSVAIEKKGQKANGREQVDAISGGTITSKGVEAMLENSMREYEKFFNR